ncbi:hypothetical protein B0H13DRAFT_230044 [Mycena leptocephala]|nr:hypothetical protein B0H13DRAFT_230044 [Mycena leptocephala]
MLSSLVETLMESMSKWDRLRVFDCPYTEGSSQGNKAIRRLVKSQRLHTLAIPSVEGLSWAYLRFKECPLEVIHIKQPVSQRERIHLPLEKDPVLVALLQYTEASTFGKAKAQEPISELPDIAPSFNPSFTPMAGATKQVHDKVWVRVLYFAMSVPELANNPLSAWSVPPRLPLLLVSKTFNQLGLSSYYAHIVLRNSWAISKFASLLSSNASIGPNVRSLAIEYWRVLAYESGVNTSMLTVFSQTTGLVRVCRKSFNIQPSSIQREASISLDALKTMAEYSLLYANSPS